MKRFVFLVVFSLVAGFAAAQMISDDDVIEILKTEQGKGKSQQEIATELVKKGVTVEQLKRIKAKVEKEKDTYFTKNVDEEEAIDRSREEGQTKTDAKKMGKELRSMLEPKPEETDEIEVFGRNIFKNELLTFEPSMNMPTPANYVLGAGDDVIIDVWGASQLNIKETISPDGKIFIDGAGPVQLAGKSVAQAEKYLKSVLNDVYGGSQISLSLGVARSIQVQVMGEVVAPGTYTISALSTAFNALYAAGGINEIGTLRDIKVYRGGKEIATIDVYDYIMNGKNCGDVNLQDNDVISVGAYVAIVEVAGKVKRPMKYEVAGDETLLDVISYAGGFAGDAYTENLNVTRKSGREYSMHTVSKQGAASFTVKDGDAVEVQGMLERYSNMVEIEGAVFFPGKYEFGTSINTVKQLIEAAGGVHEDAFLNRAVLQHRRFDNTRETQAIDLKGILAGTSPDVVLRNNDLLFVPMNSSLVGEQTISIGGEVNLPGKYKFADNTTIEDAVLQAGGLTRAASVMKVDVYRQKIDPKATLYNDNNVEIFSFSLKDGLVVDGSENFILKPFDEVFVRRNPTIENLSIVHVNGCVNFEGGYAVTNKKYRLSDLIKAAGGVTEFAYVKGANLYRQMTAEERELREITMKISQIRMLEEGIHNNDKEYNMALADSLMQLKLNLDGVYSVAINLDEAIKNPGSDKDIVLRSGDVLNVPEFVSTVRVSGEVRNQVTLGFEKGKNIKYYVKNAGGYSNSAKKNGVYIVYMNGHVVKASKRSKKIVEPGCEIVVPRKSAHSKLSPTEMATIGTSTASIATMIVAIINLLK